MNEVPTYEWMKSSLRRYSGFSNSRAASLFLGRWRISPHRRVISFIAGCFFSSTSRPIRRTCSLTLFHSLARRVSPKVFPFLLSFAFLCSLSPAPAGRSLFSLTRDRISGQNYGGEGRDKKVKLSRFSSPFVHSYTARFIVGNCFRPFSFFFFFFARVLNDLNIELQRFRDVISFAALSTDRILFQPPFSHSNCSIYTHPKRIHPFTGQSVKRKLSHGRKFFFSFFFFVF